VVPASGSRTTWHRACRYRPRIPVTATAGMTVLLLCAVITHRRAADAERRGHRALLAPRHHHRLPSRRPHQLSVTPPPHGVRASSDVARPGDGIAFLLTAGHTGVVTADQLEMISADPRVMHGQAVIAGTRVPVSVILDCLASGMTSEEITAEYPTVTVAGVRAAAAYGAALAREELLPLPQSR
jgi:uncharacterized protein (DUF433 family)